jgi:hypothetical protein
MKISGELSYRIGYDVEHDLFHAQNVFNDEYIKPTFIEYVQKLENENKVLTQNLEDTEIINAELKEQLGNKVMQKQKDKADLVWRLTEANEQKKEQLTKATEIIKLLLWDLRNHSYNPEKDMARAEEFLGRNK